MNYKEGYIQKQGKRKVQGYKRRWFVLDGKVMKYYTTQEISESNLLGIIDMTEVISAKQNKHGKNGFEIAVPNRSYYLSAKTPEERDEWLKAIQNAAEEARKDAASSTGLPNPTYLLGGDSSAAYSLVGDPSLTSSMAGNSSHTYTSVSSDTHHEPTNSLQPGEYSLITGSTHQSITSKASSIYSEVGNSQLNSSAISTYDEIPKRESLCHSKEPESIYDVIAITAHSNTKKLPLNDETGGSTSDGEAAHESSGHLAPTMSSLMSKLSMESLDSIDSLELSDDENFYYDTDGDMPDGGAYASVEDVNESLSLHLDGDQSYAAEKIKEFFRIEGIRPSKGIDFAKLEKDHNLKLDMQSEFPAIDALKKFLVTCK